MSGEIGEAKCKLELLKTLNRSENFYSRMLTNIYIPIGESDTTEVDLILLHTTGVYVFEVKDYSGFVIGEVSDKYWYEYLGKNVFSFLNPIKQNDIHINALSKFLGVFKSKFKSFIVFSNDSLNIKGESSSIITTIDNFSAVIKPFFDGKAIFTKEEVDNLYLKLWQVSLTDEKVKKRHTNKNFS